MITYLLTYLLTYLQTFTEYSFEISKLSQDHLFCPKTFKVIKNKLLPITTRGSGEKKNRTMIRWKEGWMDGWMNEWIDELAKYECI